MRNICKEKKISNAQFVQIAFLLILIGVGMILYQPIQRKKMETIDLVNQKILERDQSSLTQEKENPSQEESETIDEIELTPTPSPTIPPDSGTSVAYIGTLEIPKIALKRGFVSKDSKQNNIEQNITILKEASMPDVKGGNFILAAHSGTGVIAYFDRLDEVVIGDGVFVTYQGKQYTYQILKKYREPKTGTLNIYRDLSKSSITLITCAPDNDHEQIVLTGSLISVK